MKIVVLFGSPNRKGSTNILVEEFRHGAEESGHFVEVVDVCHADIHPCIGCVACGYEGPCVQKDDIPVIRQKLLASDMRLRLPEGFHKAALSYKIVIQGTADRSDLCQGFR